MKRNAQLILVAAALAIVAWLAGAFDPDPSTIDLPDPGIRSEKIGRIDVRSSGGSFSLVRGDSSWSVAGDPPMPADTAVVLRLVRDLSDLELASLVSRTPDRHARFGVDSTAAEVVVSWDGRETRLVVSTRGPDYQSHYVRIGTDPSVYATRGRLTVLTDRGRYEARIDSLDSQP